MKKIIFALLIISIFACKKEENKVSNQTTDSTVYYNKWTKMNKVTNFIGENITDVSYQQNKSMALLSNSRVYFIDSNFNIKTSPTFFSSLGNINTKFRTDPDLPNNKSAFYYITGADSAPGNGIRLVMMNYVYAQELKSRIYTLSYFIKDTNQNGKYTFLGYGHDYFAYYIYDLPTKYNYKLNFYKYSQKIDTVLSFVANAYFNTTFRLGNNIVFWNYSDNEFATVNTESLQVQTNQSISKDYTFIGTFNNYAYFYNFKGNSIFKTNDFFNFESVYEYQLISKILPFFDEKYMLLMRYKDTDDNIIIKELTLLNIESKSSKVISMPFENHEDILCHWVIDNTLYILTSNNIYARKF